MLTFPRPMPTVGTMGTRFEIERVDFAAPEAGGRLGGVQAGFPLWALAADLTNMSFDEADVWRAFVLGQRGSQRPFFGFDQDRRFPKAYPGGFGGMVRAGVGGGAFDGSATGWSEAIDSEDSALLTLSGLPAGLALALGDYVGFKWDQAGLAAGNHRRRALVRVIEAGTADGAGTVTVTSEPPVPLAVPAGAVAHLDNPMCVMKLAPETQLGVQGLGFTAAGGRIVALQDLRP